MDNDVLTLVCEEPDEIYLYSGAFCSVVNQLGYLSNVVQVKRQVNTYAEPANITYQGTLVFRQIHVSPVYFAPKGKVNLLLVSQLVDHGLKPVFKVGSFCIMCNKKIITMPNQSGNISTSELHSHSIFAFNPQVTKKDWHTVLGHPTADYY
ncbi:hypothetical protein O181_021196 [Austropuccinia psidii MF-1]|uniref:Uncharacterized protein n=1 Tax=Austropuccinia psidii MF-1 TaxID=1389203 RepID=A0A9Q3GVJ1_9BASI|nr:hypothetical protein [Austropuccinia psidii MF-1]